MPRWMMGTLRISLTNHAGLTEQSSTMQTKSIWMVRRARIDRPDKKIRKPRRSAARLELHHKVAVSLNGQAG